MPLPPEVLVVLDDSVMRRSDALRDVMSFARSIISDGVVTHLEARRLHALIRANPDVAGLQTVDEIRTLLSNALADGEFSDAESQQLLEALQRFVG